MIVYTCTFVEKTVQIDSYENGVDPNSTITALSEPCYTDASSLPELIKKLGQNYGLNIDDVSLNTVNVDNGIKTVEKVTFFSYNRLENVDCNEPAESEMALFKKGEIKLFLCEYCFMIEKQAIELIKADEFAGIGIKIH